jgi:TolB protein
VTNESGAWQLVRSHSKQPDGRFDVIMTDDVGRPMNPSVSPDGKQVAFSLFEQGARRIVVSNMDGSHIRVLSTGDYPSFSPKGDEIVYQDVDSTGQWQLFSINPQGENPVQLTFSPYASIHPAHDPSGEFLVFGSTIGQESRRCKLCCGLFLMRIDNGNIVQLIAGDVDADWPSWGKDGWIYFTSNESGDYDVWRLRIADDGSRVPAVPSGV